MNFEALLASLREMGGEYPDTMFDDVSTAYTEDMGVVNGKVDSLANELEALRAENLALKSHNYDLIMAGSPEPGADEVTDTDDTDDTDTEDEEADETVSDLFIEH